MEVVDAPNDDDMAQTTSNNCSSKNTDITLILDKILAHDSSLSSPSTVSKQAKHSSNKGKVLDNFPSLKHKRIKRNNSSLENKDFIIKEDSG